MIDTWFKKDLEAIYDKHQVAVFVDESKQSEFLLKTLDDSIKIYKVSGELQELQAKYEIEKCSENNKKYLIYTQTPMDKLKFAREYCETNGTVWVRHLQHYIKNKVHETLNLNLNLSEKDLISAAKVSIGRDSDYWMDLCHKGASEIFDIEKELLPFLNEPKSFVDKYDAQVIETFFRKVNEHLSQDYIEKPPETLASEVVKAMLDGLVFNKSEKTLEHVYCSWLDSLTYKSSFSEYLNKYKIPEDIDIWQVSAAHPFKKIDECWLKEIGDNLYDKEKLPNYLLKINQRSQNKQANNLGINFWKDVKILLEFDSKDIAYLTSLNECVAFYTKHFYMLDNAIRNLYTNFLNNKGLLEPFQEYYKDLTRIFLDKWFNFFAEYESNQTGILQRIINENSCKTAVIVGDGVAYGISQNIVKNVSKKVSVVNGVILADIPSETENNMSRIYMDNGAVEKFQTKREKFLADANSDKTIGFVSIDQVRDDMEQYQYLICTYNDIDVMGEKLQHKALKYFAETEKVFRQKVEFLLHNGYKKVYLVADHGFVLTGILNESDKISVEFSGKIQKSERYIRSVEKQHISSDQVCEIEQPYGEFKYLYFSNTLNPFKTPGVYGYSHGGLSPQELITPYICWENNKDYSNSLTITINNKSDLQSVTGEIFRITLKATISEFDLFSSERRVYLEFFSKGRHISKSDIMKMTNNQEISKDYAFDQKEMIEVQLLDAESKELLDKTTVIQNQARDLGGL